MIPDAIGQTVELVAVIVVLAAAVAWCVALWYWMSKPQPKPAPYKRVVRYGGDDDGSSAWLAEYFERLES